MIFFAGGVDFDSEPNLRGLFRVEVGVSDAPLDDEEENEVERNERVFSLASSRAKASSKRRVRSNSSPLARSSF